MLLKQVESMIKITAVLFIVLCLTALSYGGNKMTICIDPGHDAVEAGRAQ